MDDYAITYRGPDDSGRYVGLWAVPGDPHFRQTRTAAGDLATFATAAEAEANAGHQLVAHLRKRDGGFARATFENEHPASEGWLLARRSDGRWQIQAIDDDVGSDVFGDDFDAYCHVKERAVAGSDYHRAMLDLHGTAR